MKATTFTLLGHEVVGLKDDNDYYLSTASVEKLLGYSANTSRKILASKSLESFTGAIVVQGKEKAKYKGAMINLIHSSLFLILLSFELKVKHNDLAADLTLALADETLRRRIDTSLGIHVSEKEYDDETTRKYLELREFTRLNYHPLLTIWLKHDGVKNYGWVIQKVKKAIGIPHTLGVDDMDTKQLHIWESALRYYDLARRALNYDHTQAVLFTANEVERTLTRTGRES